MAPRRSKVSPTFSPKRNRIAAALLFAQDLGPVGTRDNRGQMQPAIFHLRERANGNLASAPKLVQQRTLARCGRVRRGVVQKRKMFAHLDIAFADFDAKCALARSRAHEIFRQNFLH